MATPHVAGVLALMLQHNPTWTVEQQTHELLTDCVEEDTIQLLKDNNAQDYCSASEQDDRCNAPGNCHNCSHQKKCAAKNYVPGSGAGDEPPCGKYYPNNYNKCEQRCSASGNCYYGTCACRCGGKYCDATYTWGVWLDFCCKTYFASCDPDAVLSSPNKLTNVFGKSGKCAAVQPHASNPAPSAPPTTTPTLAPQTNSPTKASPTN